MLICFALSKRTGEAEPFDAERIEGMHSTLTIYRDAADGPFYPHLAEQTMPDSYRFFAGRLPGVFAHHELPDAHPVSGHGIDDWSFPQGEGDGSWIALKYDGKQDTFSAAADLFNGQRWFYCKQGTDWYISNSLRFLQSKLKVKAAIEERAVPYMLLWGYLPCQLTPLEDVFVLDVGEVLTITLGQGAVSTRGFLPVGRRPVDERAGDPKVIAETLIEAVREEVSGLRGVMLPLSGGMDSRFLLGCLLEALEPEQITTLTFGAPHCWDIAIGTSLAKHLGVRSVRLEKDLRPVGQLMADNFPTSEGMYWTVPDYPVRAYRDAVPERSFLMSGYIGDPVFGSKEKGPDFTRAVQGNEAVLRAEYYDSAEIGWEDVKPLVNSDEQDPMKLERRWESLPGATIQERLDFWYFGPHTTNRTHYAVSPARHRAFFMTPFIHRRVLDLAFAMPPERRRKRKAYFEALQTRFPDMAAFPTTNNYGFPLNQPMGPRVRYARAWKKFCADMDRRLGTAMGTILYQHPRLVYNHPREFLQSQHQKDVLECFADLKSLRVMRADALENLSNDYRRKKPVNEFLLRGLLTVDQWMKNFN